MRVDPNEVISCPNVQNVGSFKLAIARIYAPTFQNLWASVLSEHLELVDV